MSLKRVISNPLNIFLLIWILILFTFQLRIATFFPAYNIEEFIFPLTSIFFFVLGFISIKLLRKKIKITKTMYFSKKRFNIFTGGLFFFILLILLINLKLFGMPPMMSFFGFDTYVYLEYGKFKGVLFALLIFMFISSLYATRKLAIFMKLFSVTILLLYVSRGNIIFSSVVYFFLLIYEGKITNKKLFYLSIFMIIFILTLFQVLGEFRTGTEVFYNSLEIKEEYRIENSGFIWLISYISMPFVNFLEVASYNNLYLGENILSRSLPAFLSFNSEADMFYKSILPNQYNTVSGYLTQVYLDFGIVGIIVYNFFLGILLSYMHYLGKNNFIKSILMTAIALLFFVDYFFYFTTLVLIMLSLIFNKFVFKRRNYFINEQNINNNTNI